MEEFAIGSHVVQANRQLLKDGKRVALGPRALAIITILASRRDAVVTKDELLETVWPDTIVEENALQVHIAAVRKALTDDATLLETIRGVGYKLHSAQPGTYDDAAQDPGETLAKAPPSLDTPAPTHSESRSGSRRTLIALLGLVALVILVAGSAFLLSGEPTNDDGSGKTTLAVVPFKAVGSDPQSEALAEGITNELIARLRRIEGLRVVTSYAEDKAEHRRLEGSLQTEGQEMRLAVQLLDVSGEIVWSQIFEQEFDTIFAVQEEIAASVAGGLSVSLDIGSEARRYGGTNNPEAYVNFIRARSQRQNLDRKVPTALLERALELDPNFVNAMAEFFYADSLSLYSAASQEEAQAIQARMDRNSARAIEIAPDLWQSQLARGFFYLMQSEFAKAERAMNEVEALDPGNDPEVRNALAGYHSQIGRAARAAQFRISMATIDPIFDEEATPKDYLYLRDFERVIAMFEEGAPVEMSVTAENSIYTLYWSLRLTGQIEEARELAGKRFGQGRAVQHYTTMDYTEALPNLPLRELRQFADERFGRGGRAQLTRRAIHASAIGNHALALNYLRIAYLDREGIGYRVLWHPALSETRKRPGFLDLIEEIGLDEAWRESGEWNDFCRPSGGEAFVCE